MYLVLKYKPKASLACWPLNAKQQSDKNNFCFILIMMLIIFIKCDVQAKYPGFYTYSRFLFKQPANNLTVTPKSWLGSNFARSPKFVWEGLFCCDSLTYPFTHHFKGYNIYIYIYIYITHTQVSDAKRPNSHYYY